MTRDPVADFTRCAPFLAAALERAGGTHTLADIADGIAAGNFHFWPGEKAAAITEIHQYPRARFLHIFLAGGDLAELLAMIPAFKSWGAFHQCSKLTLAGRLGWKRVLGDWKHEVAVLSTPLELGANEKPADR